LGSSFIYGGWRLRRARADEEFYKALQKFKELVESEAEDRF
jgi:hypothetical protein